MIKFGPKTDPPQIVTYPSCGYQLPDGNWRINIVGIAFQTPPLNLRQKMIVKMLAGVMKASSDQIHGTTFQNRVLPFFVEADKGYRIGVEIGDRRFRLKR